MSATALAGRVAERRVLVEALSVAAAGRGSLVAITGEPGIGKTALVSAAATDMAAQGFAVARGHCDESGGAPAYWPWVEVLRSISRWFEADELDAALGQRRTKLTALVPELGFDRGSTPAERHDSDDDRFLLFDSVMGMLAAAAQRRPLLIVVEDAHVADLPSLALLEFVARRLSGYRIALVITYRDIEAHLDPAIGGLLEPITGSAMQLRLEGLNRGAVAELVGEEHCAKAHELSGGNPLIAQEVARSLAMGEGKSVITGSLHSIVARRLELLTPETKELVVTAAVLGMEFELAAIAELTASDSEQALRRLGEAMRAGVVAEAEFPSGRHRFRHSLIRDAICRGLDPLDAARRHAAVAARIRRVGGEPAALAHHAGHAAAVDGWEQAVAAARAASDASLAVLAAEDAARVLDDALALVPSTETAVRLELLLDLGAAAAIALQPGRASGAFTEAEQLARSLGDVEALAVVALRGGTVPMRVFGLTGTPDAGQIGLLEEALERVPQAETELRVKLMTRLAGHLWWAPGSDQRRADLTGEAVLLARGLDDPVLLGNALMVRYLCTVMPPKEADAVALEAISAFRRCPAPTQRSQAETIRFLHALSHGDLAVCRSAAAAIVAATERYEPSERWAARCYLLTSPLVESRLDDAEALLTEIATDAEFAGGMALERSRLVVEAFRTMVQRRRGGTEVYREIGQLVEALGTALPGMGAWLPAAAVCFCWAGDERGKRLFRELLVSIDKVPRDIQWLGTMMILADGCAFAADVDHAAPLHHSLLPYEGSQGIMAMTDSYGPVDRSLGTLEAVLGRFDDAEKRFERALSMDRRMRARSSLIQTCLEYGRMLGMRNRPGDVQRVTELVAEIRTSASIVGTTDIDRMLEVYGLLQAGGAPTAAHDGAADRDPATAVLRRDGEVWEVGWRGASSRLRDSKGMRQLARLVADAGQEFHVLDLASAVRTERQRAEVAAGSASVGPVLDAKAKAAYRQRVSDLQDEIDDAEECADLERAAQAREELQVFLSELSGALGLGGRDRPVGSSAERARVAVTKTLRAAIDRIATVEPTLGAHLRSAVVTGTFCAYRPDPSAAIRLVVDADTGRRDGTS